MIAFRTLLRLAFGCLLALAQFGSCIDGGGLTKTWQLLQNLSSDPRSFCQVKEAPK